MYDFSYAYILTTIVRAYLIAWFPSSQEDDFQMSSPILQRQNWKQLNRSHVRAVILSTISSPNEGWNKPYVQLFLLMDPSLLPMRRSSILFLRFTAKQLLRNSLLPTANASPRSPCGSGSGASKPVTNVIVFWMLALIKIVSGVILYCFPSVGGSFTSYYKAIKRNVARVLSTAVWCQICQ